MAEPAASRPALVVGATSGIGRAIAAECARRGLDLVLAGRDAESLAAVAGDAAIRHGVATREVPFEALDPGSHEAVADACFEPLPPRLCFVCVGYLGDHERAIRDPAEARAILEVNLAGCVSIVDRIVERIEPHGGAIGVITSVAGDRGRRSNYYYGAAKAGLSTYLEGLAARLHGSGVTVTDLRLGPVDTRMTHGRRLPFPASPVRLAPGLVDAVDAGRRVAYRPRRWRAIMWAVQAAPASLLARLSV